MSLPLVIIHLRGGRGAVTRQDTRAGIGLGSAVRNASPRAIHMIADSMRTSTDPHEPVPAVADGVTYDLNSNHVSRSVASNTIV
jgi:hypothetical protein